MIFWNKICGLVFLLLLSSFYLSAQNVTPQKNYADFLFQNQLTNGTIISFISADSVFKNRSRKKMNPSFAENFATCQYGFFCKEELKVEKATGLALRFRLGSLQQCNYYEGKKQ